MLARARICMAVLGGVSALLAGRLFWLQCARHAYFEEKAHRQHVAEIEQPPRRGTFFYRDGRQAAWTLKADSVFAIPTLVQDPARAAQELARVLGEPAQPLRSRLEQAKRDGRTFLWVKRWIEPVQADQVRRLGLDGIAFLQEPRRNYPMGSQAANLIGFVGRDGAGLSGLEERWDRWLRGKPGRLQVYRDGLRRLVMVPKSEQPKQDGIDLVLTLDSRIQAIAEFQMDEVVRRFRPKHACALVMDPWSGEILAMANRPGYDPNRFTTEDRTHFNNWAASFVYEPGSTFKPFVLAAALEAGKASLSEKIHCENGNWKIGSRTLHDHDPLGLLTVEEIMAQSSNIGMAKIGMRVSRRQMRDALERFGFGRKPGAWLPGEEAGMLHPVAKWSSQSQASIAMGHEVASTPLQLLTAFCAFANGGRQVEPSVVLEGRLADGTRWPRHPRLGPKVVSDSALESTRRALAAVVEKGTGRECRCEYTVAGKTGTTQKVVGGRYSNRHHIATFAAFAPVEQPRLAVLVMVDEPQGGTYYASVVAVPPAREILRQSLKLLEVQPSRPVPEGVRQ